MKKRKVIFSFIIIISIVVADPARAWATSISDIKNAQTQTKTQLNQISQQIAALEDQQDSLEEEISDMDSQLVELLAEVSMIEDEIAAKQEESAAAQVAYDSAKADEQVQYEAMKTRIKFMYEKGDTAYIELFLKAKSFSDMLNKADYVEQLYSYDREMLINYQAITEQVATLKDNLEVEESELEASQEEYVEEQATLEAMLSEKKATSQDYDVQLAQAKQEAAAYKSKINSQQAQIKKLEDDARKAAALTQASTATSTGSSSYSLKVDVATINAATGSDLGKKIAVYACQYVGNPYVSGGTSLTNGADCSGFTWAVYQAFGYTIARTSYDQRNSGVAVEYSQAQPGDLICYAGHVAMYIGNGMIVHASSAKTGIKISYATYRPILAVRRII